MSVDDENVVVGRRMERSISDFVAHCEAAIGELSMCGHDTAVVGLLCDAVRLARELVDRNSRDYGEPRFVDTVIALDAEQYAAVGRGERVKVGAEVDSVVVRLAPSGEARKNCGAYAPPPLRPFSCTLPPNHEGYEHVAVGMRGQECARWTALPPSPVCFCGATATHAIMNGEPSLCWRHSGATPPPSTTATATCRCNDLQNTRENLIYKVVVEEMEYLRAVDRLDASPHNVSQRLARAIEAALTTQEAATLHTAPTTTTEE